MRGKLEPRRHRKGQHLGAADMLTAMNNLETVISHFLFLVGVNGKSNVLDWSSNKFQIPSASPLAVESEAALDLYGQVCRSHDSEHAADQQHSQGFCDD